MISIASKPAWSRIGAASSVILVRIFIDQSDCGPFPNRRVDELQFVHCRHPSHATSRRGASLFCRDRKILYRGCPNDKVAILDQGFADRTDDAGVNGIDFIERLNKPEDARGIH